MNLSETAQLLALCAAFDSRTVGEADVYAWQSVLENVDLEDGKQAARAHYAVKRERIMPADINTWVKAERARRYEESQRQQLRGTGRLALAPAPGKVGQRIITEPTPWYVQAKETLRQLRERQTATNPKENQA